MSCNLPLNYCFENTVNAFYPTSCVDKPFFGYPIPTGALVYNGPNLPNTSVNTNDNLTTALQKIDISVNPTTLVQNMIYILNHNQSLKNEFCALIASCV